MARRLPALVATLAILLLTLPGTIAVAQEADSGAVITVPKDRVVTGTTPVEVRVSNLLQPVRVRVRVPDVGTHVLRCVPDCETNRNEDGTWTYGFQEDLDPRTGAPFAEHPFLNGELAVRILVDRRLDTQTYTRTLILHVPSSGAREVAASVSGDDVEISWKAAPEADVTGYRIERVGSPTKTVATVGAAATSVVDRPGVGTHRYRVVTIRQGGTSPTIETTSATVTATISPPPPAPDPDEDGSGDDGSGDGGDGDGGGDPREAGAPPLAGNADGAEGTAEAGAVDAPRAATPPSQTRARRTPARTPTFSFSTRGLAIPDVPHPDDLFRGSLDYAPPETADPEAPSRADGGDGEVVLSVPGRSGGSFLGQLTDPDRVAVPVAAGLLLSAIGLHLWRWLKIPLA